MNNDYLHFINSLKDRVIQLIARFNEAKNKIENLEVLNIELKQKLEKKDLEKKDLIDKFNKLQLAKSVLASSDDSHEAKTKINRIVREIDNCIALLNI